MKKNSSPNARFQKRASKAMSYLIKDMIYVASFSNGTTNCQDNQIYADYILKWKSGKFDTKKMNQMLIAVEHKSKAVDIKQLHNDFMNKVYQLPRRWFIRLEIHFSDVICPELTHVRPIEIFPDEPLKLLYLQDIFNKEKNELVSSLNPNCEIRDLVWKISEYCDGIEDILEAA